MALDGGGLMGEKAVLLVFQAVVVFGFVVAIFKVHVTLGGNHYLTVFRKYRRVSGTQILTRREGDGFPGRECICRLCFSIGTDVIVAVLRHIFLGIESIRYGYNPCSFNSSILGCAFSFKCAYAFRSSTVKSDSSLTMVN